MGKYINQTSKGSVGVSASSKCRAITEDGGRLIPTPKEFVPNLVCVVDSGMFGAAAYCYSKGEFEAFNDSSDPRPKRWFIWDKVETYAS